MWFDVKSINLTTISTYLSEFAVNLREIFGYIGDTAETFLVEDLDVPAALAFSDFQLDLLKALTVFVIINCLLIVLFWKKYGEIIYDKFIRPSTTKEIEELKLSVARLKLPKDYTPRI